MFWWFYIQFSSSRHKRKRFSKAVTLIELLITIAILGTLAAIAVPIFGDYMNDSRNATAKANIANMISQIDRFAVQTGNLPNTLTAAVPSPPLDPWGNQYQYLLISGVNPPQLRKDKSIVPLNTDYDLYSMGADGQSSPPLTAASAADDIVRASNGAFIGLGAEY
jgi:general secretion pathway protein G